MTTMVFWSMTDTVLSVVLGTYTNAFACAAVGLMVRSARYTFVGDQGGGIPTSNVEETAVVGAGVVGASSGAEVGDAVLAVAATEGATLLGVPDEQAASINAATIPSTATTACGPLGR